jgi:hypothetical protein
VGELAGIAHARKGGGFEQGGTGGDAPRAEAWLTLEWGGVDP